jgi:hypothetical protein
MENTTQFEVNGKTMNVDELPKSIRDLVSLYDSVREDMEKILYQHQVLMYSALGIKNKIANDISNIIKEETSNEQA